MNKVEQGQQRFTESHHCYYIIGLLFHIFIFNFDTENKKKSLKQGLWGQDHYDITNKDNTIEHMKNRMNRHTFTPTEYCPST